MLKTIFFEICDFCNYNCEYCCKAWREEIHGTMDKELLDKLISYEAKEYVISGGEPSLCKEKVLYFINNCSASIRINTNLSNWTVEDIIELANKGVIFNIDFPSNNKGTYSKMMNSDKYNTVVKNIMRLPLNTTTFNIVITNSNVLEYKKTVNWLASLGFKNFSISPAVSVDNKINAESFFLDLAKFTKSHTNWNIVTLAKTKDVNPDVKISHKCSAGYDRIVVLTNGDVVPCAWNKDVLIGNVKTDSIEKIMENGDRYYKSFKDDDTCRGSF